MKKQLLLLISILCITACNEDIFEPYEDAEWGYELRVDEVTCRYASIVVPEICVHPNTKILLSEQPTAEGGEIIDITDTHVTIKGLKEKTIYYYCIYFEQAGIKTPIKNFTTLEYSPLKLDLNVFIENDSVKCIIKDEWNNEIGLDKLEIVEKGFYSEKLESKRWKKAIDGDNFAFSASESMEYVGAYVLCENDIYYSDNEIYVREPIIGDIERFYQDDKIYLTCEIDGSWTGGIQYRTKESGEYSYLSIDKTEYTDHGIKIYANIVGYSAIYMARGAKDDYYGIEYIVNHAILTDEDVDFFLRYPNYAFWYEYESSTGEYVANLKKDIIIPNGKCISLDCYPDYSQKRVLNGHGHVIDGFSFFPLFRNLAPIVRSVNFGTSSSVFNVKPGTSSTPAYTGTPSFFISETGVYYENCTVNGVINVYGNDRFLISGYSDLEMLKGLTINATINHYK